MLLHSLAAPLLRSRKKARETLKKGDFTDAARCLMSGCSFSLEKKKKNTTPFLSHGNMEYGTVGGAETKSLNIQ